MVFSSQLSARYFSFFSINERLVYESRVCGSVRSLRVDNRPCLKCEFAWVLLLAHVALRIRRYHSVETVPVGYKKRKKNCIVKKRVLPKGLLVGLFHRSLQISSVLSPRRYKCTAFLLSHTFLLAAGALSSAIFRAYYDVPLQTSFFFNTVFLSSSIEPIYSFVVYFDGSLPCRPEAACAPYL